MEWNVSLIFYSTDVFEIEIDECGTSCRYLHFCSATSFHHGLRFDQIDSSERFRHFHEPRYLSQRKR